MAMSGYRYVMWENVIRLEDMINTFLHVTVEFFILIYRVRMMSYDGKWLEKCYMM